MRNTAICCQRNLVHAQVYPRPVERQRSLEGDGVGDRQETLVSLVGDVAPRTLPLQNPLVLAC